ncbi:MAG: hypothetical protein JWO38_7426 [Gemmataceae bacterium]|nr:hypothetical protein [Gemmataceae bacterium]
MAHRLPRLLPAALLLAAAAAPAAALWLPSPEEIAVRGLIGTPVGFREYAFTGDTFPPVAFSPSPEAEKFAGPFKVAAAFYDRDARKVDRPEKPGPYFAVVTITPKTRPPLTRYATLYRVVTPAAAATPADLSESLGIDPKRIDRQTELIAQTTKGRPADQLRYDQRYVRLLAGLAVMPLTPERPTKQTDAFAYERQAWVTVRRRITGLDKEFPRPFDGPAVIKGDPAPVVRAGTAAEAGVKPGTAAKIDAVLTDWAANDDQAFAVCVVRRGVIVLHKAYGTRDGKPMTVSTPSWMASVTKPMAATLMLMLVADGRVGLDDPVETFVPALRGVKVRKPLLVRHLATHTNGLEERPANGDDTLNDLEYRVADSYPLLKVGRGWAYNGGGYALGGKVVENVSGEAVPLFYKRHLLDPLGCTGTEVAGTHADAFSVPLDMAKFGQMLLNKGAYGQYRFLSPEVFGQMLPRRLTAELGPDATKTFGFGLDGPVPPPGSKAGRTFGHGAASAATFSVDVENELVVIMTRNRMGKNQDKYNGKFWDAIRAGLDPKP